MVLFAASAFQQAGLLTTTAGNAGFITSLYVVIVPFVMLAGWRERPHWLSVIAVILAVAGAFLLSTSGRFAGRAGDLLELGGALLWALHVVLVGKFASKFEPISFSAGQLFFGSIFNFVAGAIFEPMNILNTPSWWGAVVYVRAHGRCDDTLRSCLRCECR